MKREQHGRAKILTPDEIQLFFNSGLETFRYLPLFGFCLFSRGFTLDDKFCPLGFYIVCATP